MNKETGKIEFWKPIAELKARRFPIRRVFIDEAHGEKYLNIRVHRGYIYDIPLSRMTTASAVLDWIHQVCVSKTWGPEVTEEFLYVLFNEFIPCEMWGGEG